VTFDSFQALRISGLFEATVRELLVKALVEATGLETPAVEKALTKSTQIEHGDFAFPCFMLAKTLKVAPPECAQKLAGSIKLPPGISKAVPTGPYLNFFLDRAPTTKRIVTAALKHSWPVGKGDQRPETIIVEFASPNIAKSYHVGHLRNILIGNSLDRIYRHLGYKVVSINHLGDWGTQFGYIYAACKLWGKPQNATVTDLTALYVRASNLKKAQEENTVAPEDKDKPDVTKMAREYFLSLESGDKESYAFWQWIYDVSLAYLKPLDTRLGVKFDHYLGESFYRDKLEAVESSIRESGILEDSRGALGVDLGKKLGFARIFAEDGRSLYITRDLAAADWRFKNFSPKKIIYVVASPQTLHFQHIVGIFERMKHPVAALIKHVAYGQVPGISTRAGTAVTLESLLEEANERALETYRSEIEKKPAGLNEVEVANKVGLGAVVFEFLSRSNTKDFNFTWEHALSFSGDSGPYLQYALARLNSIEEKAKAEGITLTEDFDAASLEDEEAYSLTSLLGRFEDILNKAADEYEPYYVSLYALELAKAFAGAYRSLRVIGAEKKVAQARLALFIATRETLKTCLNLIGIPAVDRM
jgi:arginyl-tRNA synthetase